MKNFNQTLAETKTNFSYDIIRKNQKSYAKFKSTKPDDRDIHGSTWEERCLLEITSIDLDSKQCFVMNPNGYEWLTQLALLECCDIDGNRRK